jgi:integrase
MKLNATLLRSLTLPRGKKDHIEWDDDIPGFGVRLREGGSAGFVFQYQTGSKQRRMSLGAISAVPISAARKTAAQLYARVRLGQDPAGESASAKFKSGETFGAIAPRYLEQQRKRLRPKSYPDIERHLLKYSKPLHGLQLAKIQRRDVAAVISAVAENSGAVTGNRVRTSLSGFFTWAIREGLIEANPAANTNKAPEQPRRRTLSPEELALVWAHADDGQYGSIIKLLMLTGARADEIASLRWSEVHGDMIMLPPERVKNNRGHEIPLCAAARQIIEAQPRRIGNDGLPRDLIFGHGAGGFSGWSRAKHELDARIAKTKPLLHWVPHDLRRSFSTLANELGIALPHIIEAALATRVVFAEAWPAPIIGPATKKRPASRWSGGPIRCWLGLKAARPTSLRCVRRDACAAPGAKSTEARALNPRPAQRPVRTRTRNAGSRTRNAGKRLSPKL